MKTSAISAPRFPRSRQSAVGCDCHRYLPEPIEPRSRARRKGATGDRTPWFWSSRSTAPPCLSPPHTNSPRSRRSPATSPGPTARLAGRRPGSRRGPAPSFRCAASPGKLIYAPFDVMDVEHLWLARDYPDIGQDRHQALAKRVKVFPRVPDFANAKVAICAEADVVLHPLRGPLAGLPQATIRLVVLLGGHGCRGEVDNEAHCDSSSAWVGRPYPFRDSVLAAPPLDRI